MWRCVAALSMCHSSARNLFTPATPNSRFTCFERPIQSPSYFALMLCTVLHLLMQLSTERDINTACLCQVSKDASCKVNVLLDYGSALKQAASANDRYLATPSS